MWLLPFLCFEVMSISSCWTSIIFSQECIWIWVEVILMIFLFANKRQQIDGRLCIFCIFPYGGSEQFLFVLIPNGDFRLKGPRIGPFSLSAGQRGRSVILSIPFISFDQSWRHPSHHPKMNQHLKSRVLEWGIFSVKMLHWFCQAAICLLANSSIIFGLSEFEKAKWKTFQSHFFPTCQVRVVRFYVSLFSSFSCTPVLLYSSFLLLPPPPPVAILWVQCGVPGPNCDHREFSVACRTSTASIVSSVWRAGPQLRSKGLVVLAERVCQRSSCKMSQDKSERMSEDMSARSSERMCQKEWSKICQECQKILICLKEVQRECLGKDVRNMPYCLLLSCGQSAQQAPCLENRSARDETTLGAKNFA